MAQIKYFAQGGYVDALEMTVGRLMSLLTERVLRLRQLNNASASDALQELRSYVRVYRPNVVLNRRAVRMAYPVQFQLLYPIAVIRRLLEKRGFKGAIDRVVKFAKEGR